MKKYIRFVSVLLVLLVLSGCAGKEQADEVQTEEKIGRAHV